MRTCIRHKRRTTNIVVLIDEEVVTVEVPRGAQESVTVHWWQKYTYCRTALTLGSRAGVVIFDMKTKAQ